MKCRQIEKMISRHLDGRLPPEDESAMQRHLAECPACRRLLEEYRLIREDLSAEPFPELNAFFWERLQPRLRQPGKAEPRILWQHWWLRAIPVVLMIGILWGAAMLVLIPHPVLELSQTGVLLLEDQNPFQDTRLILEEEMPEEQNMMLIFSSTENQENLWRDMP